MGLLSGTERRARKRAANAGIVVQSRGWRGVHDGTDVTPGDAQLLADAINVWFPYYDEHGGAWSRPRWDQRTSAQLGALNTRQGQCIFEHIRADGTIDRLVFLGGKMYSWNGSTTFTDITPAATTISTTARIFCCSFNEKVIVTDGVNKPWSYVPATATRAFIDVDGSATAWVAQGPPVVYAAKLFFIIASKGATTYNSRIIWSEEIDETLGYVQTGGATTYTNKWDLSQTSNDPLKCLVATNVGLYYFRRNSIGFIAGQVNAAFQTTATHDAISTKEGTLSPASVLEAQGRIWFLNQLGRPCRFAVGSNAIEDIWVSADVTVTANLQAGGISDLPRVGASVYCDDTNLMLFTIAGDSFGNDSAFQMLVFEADSGTFFGRWTLQTNCVVDALGAVTDSTGLKIIAAIGSNSSTVNDSSRGHVWRLASTADTAPFGDCGVAESITTRVSPEKPMQEFRFHRVTLESTATSALTYTVTCSSPSTGAGATQSAVSTTPLTSIVNNYGTMRASVGVNLTGRGFQTKWQGGYSGNSGTAHVFQALEVDAVPLSRAVGGQ